MKQFCLFVTLVLLVNGYVYCQIYIGNLDERNLAIQTSQQAIENIKSNDIDSAFYYLAKAISIDSLYLVPYQNLYQVLLKDNSYADTMIFYLRMANRIFEEDDQLCFCLGEAYRLADDIGNAMIQYSEAIKYSKIWGEDFYLVHYYYFNRGNCYYKKEMFQNAIDDYSYSLKLKPDYTAAFLNRGICYFKLQNNEAACRDWNKALDGGMIQAKQYIDKNCN